MSILPTILLVDLPKPHGEVLGPWYNGYPVHKGLTESSLNYATLYAHEHHLKPNPERIVAEFENFKNTLLSAGFELNVLPFPDELNQVDCLHHDAVFLRDAGLMVGDLWIKASFSVKDREKEADVYARLIPGLFNKKLVELPKEAYLEFGEIFYLRTAKGAFYFGGLSRSNQAGHDRVREILKPEHYCLIRSEGYHLDTVFAPVLSSENILVAFLVAKNMLDPASRESLNHFEVEVIELDPVDSSGEVEKLGNYAVNCLVAPGLLLNSAPFLTPGVEERLMELGVKRISAPLTDFRFAGGSVHCLTNEIYC